MASVLLLACAREGVCDVVTDYAALFNDHVEISFPGFTGGNPHSDFPLLVRLAENSPAGFSYARVDEFGEDIRFLSVEGGVTSSVPYEVDTWDRTGESSLWVRVPKLGKEISGGRKLIMYWAANDPKVLATDHPNAPRTVWDGYTAVWHLNGTASESTTNALASTKGAAASAHEGKIGYALGARSSGANGPILTVPAGTPVDALTQGAYTITGWLRVNMFSGSPVLYSARATPTDDAFGAELVEKDAGVALKLHADATTSDGPGTKSFNAGEWLHFAVVHAGESGKHTVYVNGVEFYGPEAVRTDKAGSQGLAFGGLIGAGAGGTLNGDLDDVRIYPGKRVAGWLTNEYAQVVSPDYIAFSNFSSTGKPVYVKEEEDDPTPSAPETVSPDDYAGTAVFVPAGVEEGVVLTNFVTLVKVMENEPQGFLPSSLPFGTEDIRFFNELGEVLDYEIDFWNADGWSYFWVRLPQLSRATRITMCWGLKEARVLPPNAPTAVWSGYAGVWHLTDEHDSTTNGAAGVFGPNAVQQYGSVGKAAGLQLAGQRGAILDVEANAAIDSLTNAPFTVTGWACLNKADVRYGTLFSRANETNAAWGAQFCGGTAGDSSAIAQLAGDGSGITNAVTVSPDSWFRFDFVYAADRLAFYIDGDKRGESVQAREILNGSSGRLSIGGLVSAAEGVLGLRSLNGFVDEFRLLPGVQTASERKADYDQCVGDGFYVRQPVSWDSTCTLQNRWRVLPAASKTEWKEGDSPAEFTLGEPWYGDEPILSYQARTTGEVLTEVPTQAGDYRAVFTVLPSGRFSSLTYVIDFRIRVYRPTHDLGDGNDRVLLLNDDDSISDGVVYAQAYNDTVPGLDRPFWVHDVDSGTDYTSTSPYFNFCGGLRHTYWSRDGLTRLWDLVDVRYGNTYNNADDVFWRTYGWEEWNEGLRSDMNYLAWNPEGGCLVDEIGARAAGWHEYAAQAVLCNTLNASVNSTLYTNGVGTIYFDAVNSHTDDAAAGYYRLVVEIATNALTRSGSPQPYGVPTDENIQAVHREWDEATGDYVDVVHDSYKFADWRRVTMRVKLVNGDTVTDLEPTTELTLDLRGGGSYTNFYRVYAPVDIAGNVRFRIRRTAINPAYTIQPDTHSMILVDNVICSKPGNRVRVEPRGHYDPTKVKRETVGYEGAFTPSYPSVNDRDLYARAVVAGGQSSAGAISSLAMHYRWRYLNQQCTDWMTIDLDPNTLTSFEPIVWPMLSGDLEYWYEAGQSDIFYVYADYSGLGIGVPGYSEEIAGVTNRAPTYATHGLDWFTRVRDGKSTYGEIKLFVRRGPDAPVESVEMFVARNQIWRGCLLTTNAVAEGVYFRFEGRNRQDDTQKDFQFNTNCWYLAESADKLPVSGVVVSGTTNDWGRIPCDGATGHLMFQLDESTRALTIVHADWQDFNGWNDAHRDYFTGSSTDDVTKKGVSPTQREYLCSADRWNEDCPTNAAWTETFTPGSYPFYGYDFYKKFASNRSPNGFGVGEGMWVCGSYADYSQISGMALQMTGQGRGYVQMTNPLEVPRGIESIQFNARLAQSVSPDLFAFYRGGKTENPDYFDDYSFVTRVAFDRNGNSNFTGNASLSLMAFYSQNEGCYEARWEQIGGDIEEGSGTILGPTARSQRLVLYRWRYAQLKWTATEVLAATNMGGSCSWQDSIAPRAIPATYSITNNLMPFYIGAYNNEDENYTVVIAGVRIYGGSDASKNVERGGVRATDNFANVLNTAGWLYIVYRDSRSDRLTCGTYGLLASNCEGVFVRPQYHEGIVSWNTDVAKTKTLATQVYPKTTGAATAQFVESKAKNCAPGVIGGGKWVQNSGRIASFLDPTDDDYSGFTNQVVSQTVEVYTAPHGSGNWTNVASRLLTGFGRPGVLQDTVVNLWSATDSDVKIAPGGTLDDVCTDVVVDNILISQWAGTNWYGNTQTEIDGFGPTNFVYTSGWVADGALELSPRRTKDNKPCSLRMPLCDGERNRDKTYRGLGLGSLTIWCRNPQTNVNLLVQIATNNVSALTIGDLTLDSGFDSSRWTTITNWDYAAIVNSDYVLTCSPGLHGVKGVMRVIVDPSLRARVRDVTDPTAFGSVEIVSALFRDEPPLDKGCWWGFNIRTIGDISDVEQRMYLPDNPLRSISPSLDEIGRSFALNNSVTDGCDPAEVEKIPNPFREHMPFLQSPTFASNVVGEVSFRARKYSLLKGSPNAEVTLYGTQRTDFDVMKDEDWDSLNIFTVSNTTFETYRYKTDTGAGYKAFRFAVTGVRGVTEGNRGPAPASGGDPVRVLLDDVLISEAVRARLAFRNVGAFRHDLAKTTYVPNVPSVEEQPICNEGWGVQAEIYPAMLGEEVDMTTPPRVRLHYHRSASPWGFSQWRDQGTSAWMTQATDTNNIYRSSATDSPGAIIPMSNDGQIVQYMLEVVYTVVNSETGWRSSATNWLEAADWKTPSWYYPVDYNALYGGGRADRFAAFSIIDAIAPGWAWINEINIFGDFGTSFSNSDRKKQFVEVVKPVEFDLDGWELRMMAAKTYGNLRSEFVTNTVATFGRNGLPKQKTGGQNCNYMSFIVVGNPTTTLKGSEYDGAWYFATSDGKRVFEEGGVLGHYYPVAMQLVRPSGVIEHEVAILGTNVFESVIPATSWQYSSSNLASQIKAGTPDSRIFALPDDNTALQTSTGVFADRGRTELCWNNTMKMTPGDLNEGQYIDPDYPRPGGELILVFASVDTTFGHIVQTVGTATNTTEAQTVSLTSGSQAGLDIEYTVDPWCELASVRETENGQPRVPVIAMTGRRKYKVNVAKGATKNVTVVASASVDSELRKYGLDERNRYTPAVLRWLQQHKLADGLTDFYDWESGEIHLATFLALSGTVERDMTLTEMYWLDMDPTASNMFFRAGMVRPPSQVVWKDPVYDPQHDPQAHTNLRMGVYMSISNGNGRVFRKGESVWAPYVLRGLGPGELSWNYRPASASSAAWTSETFKVTGYLNNGLTSVSNVTAWVPLRYFVFDEHSFDANFESEIDIVDPFSTSSPAYFQGWYRWVQEHEGKKPAVYLSWNIDERLQPITAEILEPTNPLTNRLVRTETP